MSSLTMVESKLPPGFRFHPRDDELVCDYLMNKWNGCDSSSLLIEVDLNKCEPWDIPETVCVGGKEWYFYSQRDRKYATGLRTNRATASGYWKATGKDRPVVRRGSLVGMRKTLVFYQGRAPKGKKTNWVMHEFRVEGPFAPPKFTCNFKQEDWVLCRVFYKSREVGSKCEADQNDEGNNSMDETSSSTLPPLMDSYITFDQTQVNASDANNNYQQVPCFSMTSSSTNQNIGIGNHISSIPHNNNYHMHHPNHNNNNNNHVNVTNTYSGTSSTIMPDDSTNLSPTIACDRKVLEAVLTHFTNKMDTSLSLPSPTLNTNNSAPNLGDVSTSNQTYLSQLAMPPHHMWNHY